MRKVARAHDKTYASRLLPTVFGLAGLLHSAWSQAVVPTAVVVTSSKLLTIDAAVAINNEGHIAFTGQDPVGSRLFVYLGRNQDPKVLTNTNTGISYAG